MASRVLFLPLIAASCALPARLPTRDASGEVAAEYRVRIDDPASKRVRMSAVFPGRGLWTLRLRVERRYAFVDPDSHFVSDVVANDAGGPLVVAGGRDRWRIEGRGPIEVSWTVDLRHREEIARKEKRDKPDQFEHPYVASDHAFLIGAALFLAPEDERGPFRVRFELPDGWPVSAPWEGSGADGFLVPDAATLLQNYLFVGEGKRSTTPFAGFEITVAVAPRVRPPSDDFVDSIAAIVRSSTELFGPPRTTRYLFVLPDPGRLFGAGGAAKRDSLVLAFGGWSRAGSLEQLVAHEFAHTLAPNPRGFADEARFANEGFADFAAALARRRAGILSESRLLDEVARQTVRWLDAAERSRLSLASAAPRFFVDRDAYDLAYAGGFVLGFVLDGRIDGGLPALYARLAATPSDLAPGVADIRDAVAELGGPPLVAAFDRLVEVPGDPGVVREFPPTVDARASEEPDRRRFGVEVAGSPPVVRRVFDGSPAARAGLREGDRIVAFDGESVADAGEFLAARRRSVADDFRVRVERDGERIDCRGAFDRRLRVSVEPAGSG